MHNLLLPSFFFCNNTGAIRKLVLVRSADQTLALGLPTLTLDVTSLPAKVTDYLPSCGLKRTFCWLISYVLTLVALLKRSLSRLILSLSLVPLHDNVLDLLSRRQDFVVGVQLNMR